MIDPIFAAIDAHKRTVEILGVSQEAPEDEFERVYDAWNKAVVSFLTTKPTTLEGVTAILDYVAKPEFDREPKPLVRNDRNRVPDDDVDAILAKGFVDGDWQGAAAAFTPLIASAIRDIEQKPMSPKEARRRDRFSETYHAWTVAAAELAKINAYGAEDDVADAAGQKELLTLAHLAACPAALDWQLRLKLTVVQRLLGEAMDDCPRSDHLELIMLASFAADLADFETKSREHGR